ncbi:MAG: hypothetical protein KDA32_06020, partial [Phycisphaerales bacterium]|nr:hypothetical protein [Phycisphaerales bacterium]
PSWATGLTITGFVPTAITDDGNTVVGSTVYNGGLYAASMYNSVTGFTDVTDLMAGVPGASDVGLFEVAIDVSADGRKLLGFTRILGLNWQIDLDGTGACSPPLLTEPPNDFQQDPNIGLFLVFNAAVIGSSDIDYQWYKNGVAMTDTPNPFDPNDPTSFTSIVYGATTQQLFIDNVLCQDMGVYHCVVSNACGTVSVPPVIGTVGPLCPGDINADRVVDLSDLAGLLAHFGQTNAYTPEGDITGDHVVDLADLAGLLAEFGNVCFCP